jgi:FG-GAP repeat/PKD domain
MFMKKKGITTLICILFLITAVSVGTSIKTSKTNDMTPNQTLPSLTKTATKIPTSRCLKETLLPVIAPGEDTQTEKLEIWKQQAKLLASDGAGEDYFTSLGISLSGDTAVIGAWGDDDLGVDSGSAYVFIRTGSTWTEQTKLHASDETEGDAFGWCTAIEGDTAFIGAAGDNFLRGSVYVFTRTGSTWTEEAKLVAADGAAGDQFGYCISLSDDTAIIGANCDDDKGFDSGSAYVFLNIDSTWTQKTKLLASDGASLDSFGGEVSISDDTILIGSCFDDDNGFDSGSAYVYIQSGTTWVQQTKLLASDGAPSDYFSAYAVSLVNDTAVIGALGDDDNGADSGSAYVFTRNGTIWTEQEKLLPLDGASQDYFGESVSLSNDIVLIGAGGDDDNGINSGSAYVFNRTNTTWTQEAKLLTSDGSAGDNFGWVLTLEGDTAMIGAYYDDDNGIDSGSTYVFLRGNEPPVADFSWTPQHPQINQSITFDASTSYDPDGNITTFEWDWDSDGFYEENHTTSIATHFWTSLGSYPVTLRVTDQDNTTDIVTKTVYINGTINFDIIITGGFGAKGVITNTGTVTATKVQWTFTLTGGMLLLGKTKTGTVLTVAAGASTTVKDIPVLGFGKTTVKLDVTCEEETSGSKSVTATVLMFFVFGVK